MCHAKASCLVLLRQEMPVPLHLALASAGNSRAARMAMMAMTTSNSMSVEARRFRVGPAPGDSLPRRGARDGELSGCDCALTKRNCPSQQFAPLGLVCQVCV